MLGIHFTELASVPSLKGQMKHVKIQVVIFIAVGCNNETSTSSKCGVVHGCSY